MTSFNFGGGLIPAQLVINETQDALIVRDMEDCIRFWNRGAERLYGWEAGEVAGQNYYSFLSESHSEESQKQFSCLEEKGQWIGELRQVTKARKPVIVESHWRVQRDESTRATSVIILNRDITRIRLLESQILRANKIETIAKLTSSIAHDLNGVLSTMQFSVHQLMEEQPSLTDRYGLESWQFSARQAAAMISQVLSMANEAEFSTQRIHVADLVSETTRVLESVFPSSIRIETSISPDVECVSGNPTQLYQAFLNLSLNSQDAMPFGGTLKIAAKKVVLDLDWIKRAKIAEAKAGAYIQISFADSGVGIPPELTDKVFDAFFTTKDRSHGNGLGLFSVANIVRNHGGFVELESLQKMGTQVTLFLPAKTETSS